MRRLVMVTGNIPCLGTGFYSDLITTGLVTMVAVETLLALNSKTFGEYILVI